MFCSILCLAGILATGLSGGWATEDAPRAPKQDLPRPDGKPADTAKPVQVFILLGQSNMLGTGKVAGDEDGTLEYAVKAKTYLVTKTRSAFRSSFGSGRCSMAFRMASIVSGQSGQRRSIPVFGRGKFSQPLSRSKTHIVRAPQSVLPRPALMPSSTIARMWTSAASRMRRISAASNIRMPFLFRSCAALSWTVA